MIEFSATHHVSRAVAIMLERLVSNNISSSEQLAFMTVSETYNILTSVADKDYKTDEIRSRSLSYQDLHAVITDRLPPKLADMRLQVPDYRVDALASAAIDAVRELLKQNNGLTVQGLKLYHTFRAEDDNITIGSSPIRA